MPRSKIKPFDRVCQALEDPEITSLKKAARKAKVSHNYVNQLVWENPDLQQKLFANKINQRAAIAQGHITKVHLGTYSGLTLSAACEAAGTSYSTYLESKRYLENMGIEIAVPDRMELEARAKHVDQFADEELTGDALNVAKAYVKRLKGQIREHVA